MIMMGLLDNDAMDMHLEWSPKSTSGRSWSDSKDPKSHVILERFCFLVKSFLLNSSEISTSASGGSLPARIHGSPISVQGVSLLGFI